jgi:dCMP deaminase
MSINYSLHIDNSNIINNNFTNYRPSWDQYFKNIVIATSQRSPCHRLQVGCLLVKDNRIISQGYNGFLPNCPHTSIIRDNHEQATIHAEQNAICDCAKRGVSSIGSTAYITHYPCIICMRLLCASGIKNIKYIYDYKNDDLVNYFASISNINITKI